MVAKRRRAIHQIAERLTTHFRSMDERFLYTPSVKPFFGSYFAMVFGLAGINSGLQGYPYANDSLVGGVTTILGALAFQSCKRRRLCLKPDSKIQRCLEFSALILVCLPVVVIGVKGIDALVTHPESSIIVPAQLRHFSGFAQQKTFSPLTKCLRSDSLRSKLLSSNSATPSVTPPTPHPSPAPLPYASCSHAHPSS